MSTSVTLKPGGMPCALIYNSYDYSIGEVPDDPSIGFLPPNNGTSGQGFVTFRIQMNDQVPSLSRIDANASIIFDQNEPILTPPIFNTVSFVCNHIAMIMTNTLTNFV